MKDSHVTAPGCPGSLWGALHRASCILSPFIFIKTLRERSVPISQIRRWSLGKSRGRGWWNHTQGLGLSPPKPPPLGARPAGALPTSTTHLLRIVAVEVNLDSWVRDLLIDSYAFHGNPWTQSRAGNRLYPTGNTGLHPDFPVHGDLPRGPSTPAPPVLLAKAVTLCGLLAGAERAEQRRATVSAADCTPHRT